MFLGKSLIYQLFVGLFVGIIIVIVGILITNQPYNYQGSIIDPPVAAPDFSLDTAQGNVFTLSNFHGKVVLLYFGYTFCPDVCPTTLYDISRVIEELGELGVDVVVAMITVDPKRDTMDKLGPYVATFNPSFYGLSGNFDKLQSVWGDYGVYREEKPVEGSSGYLVDHTARIYVINPDGQLFLTFPFGMSWQAMYADLENVLTQ